MKTIAFVLAALLAACAAPGQEPAAGLTDALSCNAAEARQCPASGCTAGNEGEPLLVPISVYAPASSGDTPRFCMATGCEDARLTPVASSGGAWRARLSTNERSNMDLDLVISADRRSFTLTHIGEDGGADIWEGACQAAGS